MWHYFRLFTQYFTAKMHRLTIILSALLLSENVWAQTSLKGYTEQVVEYSNTLQEADLRSEGAEAELRRIRREYLPCLSFDRTAEVEFSHSGVGRPWSWATALELRQIIWQGGAVTADRRKQEAEVVIRELGRELTLRGVVLEARSAYWALSYAEQMKRSMEHYTEIVRTLSEVIRRRYDEGYSAKGDLLQIESRLSDAEYQLSTFEEQYKRALHSFNTLAGNDIEQQAALLESILTITELPERCDIEKLMAEHPERQIAELRAEEARWSVKRVNSAYLPRVDITAYGTLQPTMPHTKNSGLDLTGGAVLNFSSQIYHFGERREAVRAATAEQLVYEVEIENVVDDLRLREQDAWTKVVSTRQRLDALSRGLATADENLEISTYAYNEGQTTILDVMQAQISWLQTYRNVLGAHYDYAIALAEYRYITGD